MSSRFDSASPGIEGGGDHSDTDYCLGVLLWTGIETRSKSTRFGVQGETAVVTFKRQSDFSLPLPVPPSFPLVPLQLLFPRTIFDYKFSTPMSLLDRNFCPFCKGPLSSDHCTANYHLITFVLHCRNTIFCDARQHPSPGQDYVQPSERAQEMSPKAPRLRLFFRFLLLRVGAEKIPSIFVGRRKDLYR